MSFIELRDLLAKQLDQRVEAERHNILGGSQNTAEDDAYFKEVFSGNVL
ncbi:MAG: hypothetical protein JSR69_04795 [Proteobacteria bacterium]|nr:hypothetical protein [Pseudomonadota bacterium]